jgi:hypothetical protein
MSETFSSIPYPFEIARRPSLEPEVRRAILARWSSNLHKVSDSARPGDPSDQRPGLVRQTVTLAKAF